MDENNYTFQLKEGGQTRYNAGSYDPKLYSPKYELEFSAPDAQVKKQISVNEIIMGTEGAQLLVWEIKNNSTWPISFTVKKGGVVVKN
mgnify:CR=1 FL=1